MEEQYSIPSKNTNREITVKGFSNKFGQNQQNAHKSNNSNKSNNSDENGRERKSFSKYKKVKEKVVIVGDIYDKKNWCISAQ